MFSLLLLLATAVMLPSAHAALPAAYLLCTDARLAPDVTVYYLQPLDSTTVHPITEPPVLDYDNTTSQLIFNTPGITSIKGMHAIFVENDRNNVALINTLTNPITNFYTLNTPSYSTSLNGSVKSPLAYSADLFTYVPSLDLYWRFVVGNELNTTTKIWNAVVSLYADPFRNQVPTFTVQWPISEDDEYGVMDITQNSDARQIYLSLSNWKQHGQNTIGQLMTYDIQTQKVIGNATCSTRMLLKYSASRKTLFGATLNTKASAGLQITSIVEVDPMTCKTRVLIDSSVLPAVVGAGLLEAFHDETGEWHFVWQKTYGGSSGSAFYSVNIATKKATSAMGLKYDPNNVVVSAIVSQYDGSSNFPNSNVNIDLINKIESE